MEENQLTPSQYYIEYYIGTKLCNLFGIPCSNSYLHASQPNLFYQYVLDIIKKLVEFGIEIDEFISGKVKVI